MSKPNERTSNEQYVLRTSCLGHQEDVRGLAANDACFVSASRDRTVKVWGESDSNSFTNTLTLVGHEDYVGAVAINTDGSQSKYATGSRDKTVRLWNSSGDCLKTLEGHKWQVTAVLFRSDGSIVSAALDGTIRVWNEEGKAVVLDGHQGPVQCLAVLPDGDLLSGSNDKTIRRWVNATCQQIITGHEDTVRGLAVLPGLGFVSASHDTTLRIWTADGQTIATLLGHTALVYSAAAASNGLIASASEDNTARLWRPDGTCIQVIRHAACVWDVIFLPNTDLVTACADSAAHVWTTDDSRTAATEEQQVYMAAVEACQATASGAAEGILPQGLKVEDPMVLTRSGTRDGQTAVVSEGSAAVAYSWSQERNEWEKLGEVVGGPQDTMAVGNKQHANQSWDYVFDVDIADGAPVKKLAANKGEDPYDVTDRFLQQEQLPLSYREQIAQFVVDNSRGGIIYATPSYNVDPFTGGGSYVPGGNSSSVGGTHEVTGGGADPFTGSAAPRRVTDNGPNERPQHNFYSFTSVPKAAALADKIRGFGQQLADSEMALTDSEGVPGGLLDSLLSRLPGGINQGDVGGSNQPTEAEEQLLIKLLGWPAAQLFPILDVARLLALDNDFARRLADGTGAVGSSEGGLGGALATAIAEPQSTPNQQTGLRLVCNAFVQPQLRSWISGQIPTLLDGFAVALTSPSKAVRLGSTTFLLNCALLTGKNKNAEVEMQLLSGLLQIVSSPTEIDVEIVFRCVTAISIILEGNNEICSTAKDLGLVTFLSQKQNLEERVASVTNRVLCMLK